MKKINVYFLTLAIFLLLFNTNTATAKSIDEKTALSVGRARLTRDSKTSVLSVKTIEQFNGQQGIPLFYMVRLDPVGFIIVSADNDLPPVIAYGYSSTAGHSEDFIRFVTNDLEQRIACLGNLPITVLEKRHNAWGQYLNGKFGQPNFQQWPEAGTTSTGGWLETNWTQNDPYNAMCPLDPLNGNRSIAGCPSVAMGMIVNFHQTTNQVNFTDADDYHHVYAGRNYWIDDDYIPIDFPSFPMLNVFLDTLSAHYFNAQPLTNNDKAALVFACGVAARQVYTSSGSGTFGVDQAFDAYQKFNFTTSELLHDTDTNLYTKMAQNMMDTLPVHLAVVDPGWTMGHNVVVDGYNTDNYFHLNFGWGGSYNGWYLLPDEIPYGLTVIEGAIVDIIPGVPTGFVNHEGGGFSIHPNPATGPVTITCGAPGFSILTAYSVTGNIALKAVLSRPLSIIDFSGLPAGIYMVTICNANSTITKKLVKL